MAKATVVVLTPEQNAMLQHWMNVEAESKAKSEEEFALRAQIVKGFGFDPSKLEGTQSLEIGNGWKLQATKTQSYSATNAHGETEKLLNVIGAVDPGVACALVKWSPDLSKKQYKALVESDLIKNEEIKTALAAAITIKTGAPSLALIEPKTEPAIESNIPVYAGDGNIEYVPAVTPFTVTV